MSKHKDRPKPKPAPRFWADMRHENDTMTWGVECDDPALTFDGRYVLIVPGDLRLPHRDRLDRSGDMAQRIANALSGRRALR